MTILSNRNDGPDDFRDARLGTMIGANQKDDPPLVAVSVHSRPVGRWMFAREIRHARMWDVVPTLIRFE
jgi:hypothetical protein